MGAALPSRGVLAAEAKVDLIHQGRSLQSMPVALASQMVMREAPQLFINHRHKLVESLCISVVPPSEDAAGPAARFRHDSSGWLILSPLVARSRTTASKRPGRSYRRRR